MTTTLGEFYTMVSDALGKGTSLDSVIAKRTEMAAGWIERNYTFQYMKQWRTVEVDPDAAEPHIVSLFGLKVKKINLLRKRSADGAGGYVFSRPWRQVSPADRETRTPGVPESFWLNGVSSIILNSIPEEAMTLEGHFNLYTAWGSGSSWTHWLLDNATQLLLCKTLMLMAFRTRDPKLYQMYEADLAKEQQSFNVAEEELRTEEVVSRWEPPEFSTIDESLRSA